MNVYVKALLLASCCAVIVQGGEFLYSPLLLNSPYALGYPYLQAPLIAGFPSTTTVLLKHHTPEHTAQQEREKEEKNKEKPQIPQTPAATVPATYIYPYASSGKLYVVSPTAPLSVPGFQSQYHSQDELGQYRYGYISPLVSKDELKTFDGITRGSYTYVDANGELQTASYVSDALGFRIAATNIPKQVEPSYIPDSPEVAEAKARLFALQNEHIAKLAAAPKDQTKSS